MAKEKCLHIIDVFMGPDSVFEVHARKHAADMAREGDLNENIFDEVMTMIERDLGRALQTLWSAPVFKTYVRHRSAIEALCDGRQQVGPVKVSNRGTLGREGGEDPLIAVRKAYGREGKVVLKRQFDVGSPYAYSVHTEEGEQIGWCRVAGEDFCFVDQDEKPLIEVPTAQLLGRATRPAKMSQQQQPRTAEPEEDAAGSGCCGSGQRSRAGSMRKEEGWWVKSRAGVEFGPIATPDMKTLWRFHLMADDTLVRQSQTAEFRPAKEDMENFSPTQQIQLVDPTMLNEMGAMEF